MIFGFYFLCAKVRHFCDLHILICYKYLCVLLHDGRKSILDRYVSLFFSYFCMVNDNKTYETQIDFYLLVVGVGLLAHGRSQGYHASVVPDWHGVAAWKNGTGMG
jgi:hypothetical protein